MTTYANLCERSARSLFRIAEAAEEYPGEGIEALRHLVVVSDSGVPVPIDRSTPTALLKSPHPMAGQAPGTLVGAWTTEGWEFSTASTRWESPHPGVLEWTTAQVEPLGLSMTRGDYMALGMEWYCEDYSRHCDVAMPVADRERVAVVLETAGAEGDSWKGEAGCRTTDKIHQHSERIKARDRLANLPEIRWPPIALAALVREAGLRIDPTLLYRRFGIRADGTRPAIVPSSHA